MSEPNEPTTDRLRDALGRTADDLSLDPVSPTDAMKRGTTRRRRRRVVLVGAAAAVGVVAVGAVVANRDLGDDTIELATPETTAPAATNGDSADDSADTTPVPTTPPTTAPITTPPTLPAATAAPVATSIGPNDGPSQVLPWRDGFLSISFSFAPQPLTPLSDELAALFPDEVTALFPDGLPPTVDEAVDVLEQAGLLDEVSEILSANPEVSEALYATPPSPPTVRAAYTVDGTDWTVSEIDSPTGYAGQFTVADDRLFTWSTETDTPFEPGIGAQNTPRELVISSTNDLTTWETTTIDLAVDPVDPVDSDHVRSEVYVESLAVSGDRWIAQVNRHTWVDYESLLPDDVVDVLFASEDGFGIGTSADGLEVELVGDDGSYETAYEFTWAELGLDGEPEHERTGPGDSTMLVGTFGGSHEELPNPEGVDFGRVATLGDRFVVLGDSVHTSADGRTWEPIDGLTDQGFWHSVTPVSGGHLFVGDGRDGAAALLRLHDGTVTEAVLPELPERYSLWSESNSAAWVTEIGTPPGSEWEPIEVTMEHDGYTLDIVEGPDGTTFALTDSATGELIRSGSTATDDHPDIWEFDEPTDASWIVIRDDTGAEIVRIPGEVVDEAFQAAFEANEGSRTVVVDEELDQWRPDFWLIATADGVEWFTVDLEDPGPETEYWPHAAAVNDGSVLYLTPDGWILQRLPG